MESKSPKKVKKAAAKKTAELKENISVTEAAKSTDKSKKSATPKKAVTKKASIKKSAIKKDNKELITVNFQLTYGTSFGQNIFISGNISQLGNGHDENAFRLHYIDHLHWGGEIKLSRADIPEEGLKYFYIIQNEDGSVEKSAPYYLYADDLAKDIHVFDAWNYTGFLQNAFAAKVFDVLNDKPKRSSKKPSAKKSTHQFKIIAPALPENHVVFLTGNNSELGNWGEDELIFLSQNESGIWLTEINIKPDENGIEYKYGVYDLSTETLISFEEGDNRVLSAPESTSLFLIVNDGFIRYN